MSDDRLEILPRADGYQIRYGGRFLYSDGAPRAGAERRASGASLPARHLVIIPSPLLWYGVERLLERPDCPQTVLCVEADSTLAELSLRSMPKRLQQDARLVFLPHADTGSLEAVLTGIRPDAFSGCDIVSLSGGYSLNRNAYRRLEAHLRGVLRQNWQNRLSLIRLGRRWLLNAVENLPELAESCSFAELTFSKPVILAGAGESLEEYASVLREWRDSITLVAVDTALGWLAAAGLVPDLVIVLEAQLVNCEHLLGLLDHSTAFGFDLSSAPQLVRRVPAARRFFFASRFAETALLDRVGEYRLIEPWIAPRGSVAVAALDALASRLRAPVYLLGLDFSFRLGKPHARGTGSHRWYLRHTTRLSPDALYDQALTRPLLTLTDKSGRPVRSDTILAGYLDQLRGVVASIRQPVFDLGSSGLELGVPRAVRPEPGPSGSELSELGDGPPPDGRPHSNRNGDTSGVEHAGLQPVAPAAALSRRRRTGAVAALLKHEIHLLGRSVRLLEAMYRAGVVHRRRLETVLRACDYLDLDFPAPARAESANGGTVHQLLVSARHYLRVLRNTSARCE